MMAPTCVTFFLAFFAYLQIQEAEGFFTCVGDPSEHYYASCSKYERIKFKDRLMTCNYFCDPSKDIDCSFVEEENSPCWIMDYAPYGKCFKGVCYSNKTFWQATKGRESECVCDLPCEAGNDYVMTTNGDLSGGQYYCKQRPNKMCKPCGRLPDA
uniref:7DB family protein n=1 Tax=Ornithodoros coriaceus TaxID=92741 RepID=B2D261_ORNCO|nr:7DB family protein [Ornithodoros coriaceus]